MPNEIKIAVAIEEGIAYLEKNPGTISKLSEFVAQNYSKAGVLGLAALALAGCSKSKDTAGGAKSLPATRVGKVLGSGEELGPDASPPPKISINEVGPGAQGGIPVLSRLDEKQLPKSLPLQDIPGSSEKSHDFVFNNLNHLELVSDADLATKRDLGPLGNHNLRPVSDVAPNSGSVAGEVYAVALDKANRPVDILAYDNPGTGARYQEQYQFKYAAALSDGSNRSRVTVMDWRDSAQTTDVGPHQKIGKTVNTLEGVTQYYYDATGKCIEAQYFDGWSLKAPRAEWKPALDVTFTDSQVSISERNPRTGEMTKPYTPASAYETDLTMRSKASRFKFYNLLGPSR